MNITITGGGMSDQISYISVDSMRLSPGQEWRGTGDLTALAESIRSHGVLKPLVAARDGEDFVISCGARRWTAAQMVGLKVVPCYIVG